MDQLRLRLARRRTSSIKAPPFFPNSVYRPLNPKDKETRLLLVNTTEQDAEGRLICDLCHVSLSRSFRLPKYEAISWCWGESEAKEDILLDGKVFAIPANAVKALYQLCFVSGHARVWIDCVCINQGDVSEQGHQVSMMQDVYSKAERVLIWLGDEDGLTDTALQSMEQIHGQCTGSVMQTSGSDKTWEQLAKADQQRLLDQEFWDRGGEPVFSSLALPVCQWHAVEVFYASPWFTRLWVVQEVLLGKEIICYRGAYTRSWNFVGLVARWMIHRNYLKTHAHAATPPGIQNASEIWSNHHKYRSADLSSLLLMSISLEATDPKDKIYGIYGLLQNLKAPARALKLLEPDYTKTLQQIYTSATLACLEQKIHSRNALYPLELAQLLVPKIEEDRESDPTPSWVPRYDWKFDQGQRAQLRNPNASGDSVATFFTHRTDPSVLRVKGLYLGTVRETSETIDFDARCDVKDLSKIMPRLKQLALRADTDDREFALTLTCGTSQRSANAHKDPGFMEQYHKFEQECQDESLSEFSDEGFRFCLAIWLASRSRRIFLTKKRIGMGPSNMMPDDTIAILLGSNVPFLLRSNADGESYRIIGTAYICNAMAGEYVQKFGARLEQQIKWFDLR